jgi:hypothetical protein
MMRKCTVYNPTTLDDDVLDDDVLDDDDVPLFLSTYIQPFPLSHRSILLLPYTRFTGAPLALILLNTFHVLIIRLGGLEDVTLGRKYSIRIIHPQRLARFQSRQYDLPSARPL